MRRWADFVIGTCVVEEEEVQKRLVGEGGQGGQEGGKKVPQEKIRGLAEKIVKEELLSAKAP